MLTIMGVGFLVLVIVVLFRREWNEGAAPYTSDRGDPSGERSTRGQTEVSD